jgi:hypothetical protein
VMERLNRSTDSIRDPETRQAVEKLIREADAPGR